MKHLKKTILNNNHFLSLFFIFFNIFTFLVVKKTLMFFQLKKNLVLYLNFFFLKKLKKKLNFIFFLKKKNKILDLSFFILQKFKLNLNFIFLRSNAIIFLKGRGFRLLEDNKSFLSFKLGLSHNIFLKLNTDLKVKTLLKNGQKFKLSGNLINIIQILACLNYLKKKNVFTSKGIFFHNEKIKLKKSTKSVW